MLTQSTMQRVGLAVRRCRLSRGMTQQQLAELVGIDDTYLSKLERGHLNVTLQTLDKIAAACKTDFFTMLQSGSEDGATAEIVALLSSRDDFERQMALDLLRAAFQARP